MVVDTPDSSNEFWSPMYGDLKDAAEAINQIAIKQTYNHK